jgi:alpha-glucosidase
MHHLSDAPWWQRGVIYQIYPRSYQDTDGDGVGDLPGIEQRLDHLAWLGIDAIWISPIQPSPMADFGYDVSGYTDVDPLFGTLADLDRLVAAAHARGIRVLLDFVPNHSSDRHPWFIESRASRSSPKRGWYIWRDARPDGSPPNNWQSLFGGSAWEWDDTTGQYYYHAFLKEQPDLDWSDPEVRAAMHAVLRFWLARGIDGFRIDVLWHLAKDEQLRDDPDDVTDPEIVAALEGRESFSADRPGIERIVAELRTVADEFDDRVLIGELYLPLERLVRYYGEEGRGVHLPFNFGLILWPWDAPTLGAWIERYESLLTADAWPNWVLGNHDRTRVATRLGEAQARVAATLLLTLRGTPTLYYGDEIGMLDVPIPPERIRDPQGRRDPALGRDPERAPMRWDGAQPGAGFTTGDPWLPLGDRLDAISVAAQRDDPASMLTLHRRLLALRRAEPALALGSYEPLGSTGSVLAYRRATVDGSGDPFVVLLNLTNAEAALPAAARAVSGTVEVSTLDAAGGTTWDGDRSLAAHEGVVIRVR